MDERERARARRRRKRRQQKSSVKWPRVILAIVVVFTLLGGIGYGMAYIVVYLMHIEQLSELLKLLKP